MTWKLLFLAQETLRHWNNRVFVLLTLRKRHESQKKYWPLIFFAKWKQHSAHILYPYTPHNFREMPAYSNQRQQVTTIISSVSQAIRTYRANLRLNLFINIIKRSV